MHRKYALLIFILQMRAIKLAKFKCLLLEAHVFPPAIHKMQEELEWLTTALGRSSEVSFGWRCFLSTSWSLDPSTLQVCHWSAETGLRTYVEVLRDPTTLQGLAIPAFSWHSFRPQCILFSPVEDNAELQISWCQNGVGELPVA